MTKTSTAAFSATVASFIGHLVAVATAEGAATYKIASLSDKIGSLKDGSKGEYVVLQSTADESVLISLHPQKAKTLFTKGKEGAMELIAEEVAGEAEVVGDVAGEVKAPSKKARFMEVFNAGVAAGKSRKEIKVDAAALGMSDAGFNTYYQNAKAGLWA